MPDVTTTTYRRELLGLITDFLAQENMTCPQTANALIELVVSLSHYREEGVRLFPKVVICDDLTSMQSLVQGSDAIQLGLGQRGVETMKQALKKGATLARNGWALYIHRAGAQYFYGVFREPALPTALDIRDTVAEMEDDVHILLACQLGERAVELLGSNGHHLRIHFSGVAPSVQSPREAIKKIVAACVKSVSDSLREPTASYLRTVLSDALQLAHGALIAVVGIDEDNNPRVPESIAEDGTYLDEPVDIPRCVKELMDSVEGAQDSLVAYSNLLSGMLQSDGITVLTSDGRILGFNAFVRFEENMEQSPRAMVGGARRRAYSVLSGLVQAGEIDAAFFQSSDGVIDHSVADAE